MKKIFRWSRYFLIFSFMLLGWFLVACAITMTMQFLQDDDPWHMVRAVPVKVFAIMCLRASVEFAKYGKEWNAWSDNA